MLTKKIMALGLTAAITMGMAQPAMAETVMIAQGNTAQVGDNIAIYEAFNANSAYNGGKMNRGWSYANQAVEKPVAGPSEFQEAGNANVLYWTGHGEKGAKLNPQYPTSNITKPSTYFSAGDYTSAWSGNNLTVAIFAACYQLDKGSGSADVYAKAMQNSNVRVVAGYHESGPTAPTDKNIATEFMKQVNKSESVRNAWMLANQSQGASSRWAVLTYKSNSNQYYRMPAFNFKYYAPPTDKTVYRFYLNNTDPSGGGEIIRNVNMIADINQYPTELVPSDENIFLDFSSLKTERDASNDTDESIISLRDFNDSKTMAANSQRSNVANEWLSLATTENIRDNALIENFDLIEDAFAEETGEAISGSERKIGETTIYHNTYNGIRLNDNNIIVNADADGIYSVINNWTVPEAVEDSTMRAARLSAEDAKASVLPLLQNGDQVQAIELIYDLKDDTYRLSYEVTTADSDVFTVDCENGSVTAKTK